MLGSCPVCLVSEPHQRLCLSFSRDSSVTWRRFALLGVLLFRPTAPEPDWHAVLLRPTARHAILLDAPVLHAALVHAARPGAKRHA